MRAQTATNVMPPLQSVLQEHEITQAEFAKGVGLSSAAACRLVKHGLLPARRPTEVCRRALGWLQERGVPAATLKKVDPDELQLAEVAPVNPETIETQEEETMLLPPQTLSEEARRQFSLFTDPFQGEVTTDEQMYVNGNIRFVREVAWQTAMSARMAAIVGESGSGKTTMLDDLKENLLRQNRPVVCIEPSMEGAEETDTKGKTVKAVDIQTAIVRTFNARAAVASNGEARSRQVREALTESCTAGHSHLLIIEEAHALPVPTINHLKRLREKMRLGRRFMLGILLVGHPELEKKLARWDVREVMQRIEVARLPPLGADLAAYLQCRAAAAGRALDEFITPDGVDELRSRLTVQGTGQDAPVSLLNPLNVNNWMSAALNTAALLGAPVVGRDVIRAV